MAWGRRSKYNATKIIADGERFDSKDEYRRWQELKLLEQVGEISDLERQKMYVLIPVQKDPKTGKIIEHAVKYIADFVYVENEKIVVEDVKSPATKVKPEYVIKRKLMLYLYGVRIREIVYTK